MEFDLKTVALGIIVLGIAIPFILPFLQGKLSPKTLALIEKFAKIAVKKAEQMYLNNEINSGERKTIAIEFIVESLKLFGVVLSDEQLLILDGIIESYVFQLPKTHQ